MRVWFLTKGDRIAASSRQRAFNVAEELKKRGIDGQVYFPGLGVDLPTGLIRKVKVLYGYLQLLFQTKPEDIIYLQRIVYFDFGHKIFIALLLLLLRRKIIFDFDDAIYFHAPLATKVLTKLSNAVIVGSHSLFDWAKKYNQNVYIIPTVVRFKDYSKYSIKYLKKRKIIIGWNGSSRGQYENLKILPPILSKLAKKLPLKFILIGSRNDQKVYDLFKKVSGLEVEFIDKLDWANPKEVPSHIQKFDIGLNPLVNDEFNRGKCAFKAIEYMACGIPTVCSAVGENNYLIEDGVNGYLAKTTNEWVQKISFLVKSHGLRKKIGLAGQATIKAKYCYKATMPKLITIFKNL